MKALVGAFNQEKALVGAFSVIVQLHRWIDLRHYYYVASIMQSGHVHSAHAAAGCCMKLTRKIEPFLAIIISSNMFTVSCYNWQ